MYFSTWETKLLTAMDGLADFTLTELYPLVTDLDCQVFQTYEETAARPFGEFKAGEPFPLTMWMVTHDHEPTMLAEVQRAYDFCLRLVDLGFLDGSPNAQNRAKVVFTSSSRAGKVPSIVTGDTLERFSATRYRPANRLKKFLEGGPAAEAPGTPSKTSLPALWTVVAAGAAVVLLGVSLWSVLARLDRLERQVDALSASARPAEAPGPR